MHMGEGAAWAAACRIGQLRHLPPPERARPGLAPPSAARLSTCAQETQQTARGNRDQEQEPDETKQKERTPVGHKENWVSFPIRILVQGLQDFIPKFLDLERRKGKPKTTGRGRRGATGTGESGEREREWGGREIFIPH